METGAGAFQAVLDLGLEKAGDILQSLPEVSRRLAADVIALLSLLHRAGGAGGTQQSPAKPAAAGQLGE